jgi:hypothetical protein
MEHSAKYITEPTKRTPWIVLEPGRIFVMGRSIPENPGEFYRPVYNWISNYVLNNKEETRIEFGFEYINTSSTKWIYNIMKEIAEMKDLAENARILWYYEQGDEDMCELGFILRSLVECPFFVVEVEGMNKSPYEPIILDPI